MYQTDSSVEMTKPVLNWNASVLNCIVQLSMLATCSIMLRRGQMLGCDKIKQVLHPQFKGF